MKIKLLFLFIVASIVFNGAVFAQNPKELLVFHSLSCHRCIQAKTEYIPVIAKEFGDKIIIRYFDVADVENYKHLLGLRDKYPDKLKDIALPVFYIQGDFLAGDKVTKDALRALVRNSLTRTGDSEKIATVNLASIFKNISFLGITVAGLEDGINPCAFTVIVFFISYLLLQGYRKKQLAIVGGVFIAAVFLTYFLIGLGLFNFLYAFKGFWMITKMFNIVVGCLSIVFGILAVIDYVKFKRTADADSQFLQLPKAIKNQIHSVIGMHYRKGSSGSVERAGLTKLIVSAVITGFLVTLLEAVCTGQIYLPTIAFILKTSSHKLQAFLYLFYYNILFILPLFVILFLALAGVTSKQFADFMRKNLAQIKLFMAGLFFALGIFLLWRA